MLQNNGRGNISQTRQDKQDDVFKTCKLGTRYKWLLYSYREFAESRRYFIFYTEWAIELGYVLTHENGKRERR